MRNALPILVFMTGFFVLKSAVAFADGYGMGGMMGGGGLGGGVMGRAHDGKIPESVQLKSLFRIVFRTKGLFVRIPVESVDRTGRVQISSRKVLVSEEALYFDKKGVLQSVSYYQNTGGRELLLKGPNEYMMGGLAPMVVLGYFPYSSSIPEGLSFFTNTLQGSTDSLWISDVFPPLFVNVDAESGRSK